MSNSTVGAATPIDLHILVFGAAGYIVLGVPTALLSVLVVCSIARYSAMRDCKELIILMALAAADVINLIAYISAGAYRLTILLRPAGRLLHGWECVAKPHVFLWSVAYPLSALMLVVVSADRLLLVTLRGKYIFGLGRKYAWSVVSVCYLFCITFAAANLSAAFLYGREEAWLSPYCRPIESFSSETRLHELYRQWYEYSSSLFPMVSVLLFLAVVPIYKCNSNRQAGTGVDAQEQMNRQNKLTKSVAVSCMCTFVLAVVPGRLAFVFWNRGMFVLAYCCWHLMLTNPLANIAIYQLRHADMRTAMTSMLKCKQMPDNLDLWPSHTAHSSKRSGGNRSSGRGAARSTGNAQRPRDTGV